MSAQVIGFHVFLRSHVAHRPPERVQEPRIVRAPPPSPEIEPESFEDLFPHELRTAFSRDIRTREKMVERLNEF